MKKGKQFAAWLITLSVLTAGRAVQAPVDAAEIRKAGTPSKVYKQGAVVPAAEAPSVRRAAKEKSMSDYYITSGKTLDKVVARLMYVNPEETGLNQYLDYSFRMDKTLAGDYFYHLRAFLPGESKPAGDYLVAKDDSCVFRRFPGEARTELLDGITETLGTYPMT